MKLKHTAPAISRGPDRERFHRHFNWASIEQRIDEGEKVAADEEVFARRRTEEMFEE